MARFVSVLTFTFLVLLPEVEGASIPRNFRPINLIGCIYKLLAKMLARLVQVAKRVVGEDQYNLSKRDKFLMLPR